jgi:hypothetical protein
MRKEALMRCAWIAVLVGVVSLGELPAVAPRPMAPSLEPIAGVYEIVSPDALNPWLWEVDSATINVTVD